MTTWLIAIDREYCSYEELKYRRVLAQGWSAIGDLSPLLPVKNSDKFKEIISNYVSYVYDGWYDSRDPGRILLNLVSFKKGDHVICCEGETVRGIARLSNDVKYHYANYSNPTLYEYAQTIYPVTDWKDIPNNYNHNIRIKAMGPVGIQRYGGDVNIQELFDSL